jgi:hypothetical protein
MGTHRAGDVAQEVEFFLCKHKALSSNPGPTKKKKKGGGAGGIHRGLEKLMSVLEKVICIFTFIVIHTNNFFNLIAPNSARTQLRESTFMVNF